MSASSTSTGGNPTDGGRSAPEHKFPLTVELIIERSGRCVGVPTGQRSEVTTRTGIRAAGFRDDEHVSDTPAALMHFLCCSSSSLIGKKMSVKARLNLYN